MELQKLKDRREKLIVEKSKANSMQNIFEEVRIDKKIAQLDIFICDLLLPRDDSQKLFNPLKANKIKAVSMEKVGLDYIPLIKGAYNIIAGRGGSGKSGVALKSMIKWLNINPNKQALAFFTEDGISEIEKRVRIICQGLNLDYKELLSRIEFMSLDNDDRIKWVGSNRDGYVINDDYIDAVINFCKENSIEYIILDPLKRFHSLSENSNDDMDILVRDIFTKVAVETTAVVLALHHSSKGVNGARGASTITDSARMAWQIDRFFVKDSNDKIILDPNKKDRIKLEIIKDNLGIEKDCTIRNEDNSIANPLSGIYMPRRNTEPIVTEYKESGILDMPENIA